MDAFRGNSAFFPPTYTPVPVPIYPHFPGPSSYPIQPLAQQTASNPPPHDPPATINTDPRLHDHAQGNTGSATPNTDRPQRNSVALNVNGNGVKKRRAKPDDYRHEIEERTRNGESCEQIADALNAQGAQVNAKSIGRWRIAWGFRKRAVRKRSKPPKPPELRVNRRLGESSRYKTDIVRMSQQGLSETEIARIMTARGMELKKGTSTIARLQTVWGLRGTDESRADNKRYLSRRKARRQQLLEFQEYARDLGVENPDEWVKQKMDEPAVKQMRHNAAYELMGDAAPEPRQPKSKATKKAASQPRKKRNATGKSNGRAVIPYQIGRALSTGEHDETSHQEMTPVTTTYRTLRPRPPPHPSPPPVTADDSDTVSTEGDMEYLPMVDDHGSNGSDDDNDGRVSAVPAPRPDTSIPRTPATTNAALIPPEELINLHMMLASSDDLLTKLRNTRDLVEARSRGKPTPGSLAGSPPSAQDIEAARRAIKDVAQAIINDF